MAEKLRVMSVFVGRDKGQVPAVLACAREYGVHVTCCASRR